MELFELFAMSAENPTLFEAISKFLLPFGTHAARPSATDVPLNAFYVETDTEEVYQNQAGTWVKIATVAGGGGGGVSSLTADAPLVVDAATGDVTILHDDSGVTPGTYGDSGNVAVVTVDAQGHVTDVTEAAISGGGGDLTLVETKLVTGSAVDSLTFSGLDGDADGIYRLLGLFIAGTGSDCTIGLQFNADTTSNNHKWFEEWTTANADATYVPIAVPATGNTNKFANFDVTIFPLSGVPRIAMARSAQWGTTQYAFDRKAYQGLWKDTSSNVTSLKLLTTVSNNFGVGTKISLYKLAA